MKIGQTPPEIRPAASQVGTAAPAKSGQAPSASAAAASNAAQSARSAGVAVTVSTLTQGLEKTKLGSAADIDTQKVASVKASIQDGTYVVNPEAIADKLLSNSQEMLQRTTR